MPAKSLLIAIKKLNRLIKGELSFNEEYTIEVLFHESVHSKIKKQPESILQLAVLETCTQLYARNNYTKIF